MQHIRCLNIGYLFEYAHEFRQVIKLCKSGLGAVATALRRQLDGGDGFSKVGSPIIEVYQAHFLQGTVLQVPLDGIKLHHAVGDGCAGGKDHAAPAGQLVQILTLHKEVRTFLSLGLGDAAYIPHFRHQKEVLKIMALVNENAVNTQFLKRHNIVFPALVVEFRQLRLQRFTGALHLFDGVAFRLL